MIDVKEWQIKVSLRGNDLDNKQSREVMITITTDFLHYNIYQMRFSLFIFRYQVITDIKNLSICPNISCFSSDFTFLAFADILTQRCRQENSVWAVN